MFVTLNTKKNGDVRRTILRLDAIGGIREHKQEHPTIKPGCTLFMLDGQVHETDEKMDDVMNFMSQAYAQLQGQDLRPLLHELWVSLGGQEELDSLQEDMQSGEVPASDDTQRKLAVLEAVAKMVQR